MRFVLTVYGVPVGHVYLAGGARACGYLLAYPTYHETGLAAVAARFGKAFILSHGPRARRNPRQRRLRREAHAEQRHWQTRLGLLGPDMRPVPAGLIRVVSFPNQCPTVVIDSRARPIAIGAWLRRPVLSVCASARPAA